MPIYRAQTTMPYITNIPKDVSTNTLYFHAALELDSTDATILANLVADFYRIPNTTGSVGIGNALLSNHFSRAALACRTVIWNLDDPLPRVAIAEVLWTLPALAGAVATIQNMPAETAIVMSIFNAPVSGIPAGRQRNRIYVGPIMGYGGAGGTATALPRVGSLQADIILDSAQVLRDQVFTAGFGCQWVVYSATAQAAATEYYWPVYRLRVNDEYDTQRRRQPSVVSAWQIIV